MIKEKDKYRLLIENLPDGLAYCKMVRDNTGKPVDYIFLEVNSSFEVLTGLPRENIIDKKLTEVSLGIKSLGLDLLSVFDQVAATGQSTNFQQYLDQQDRWYEITAYSDQPGYFAAVFHDITKRKQSEKALQESNEIFKQFMENSPNYVFFKNDKDQAIRLSSNYEKMLGKPMHELLGKTMDDLFPSDLAKSMIADDLRVLNEGKQVTVEEELNGRFYTTIKFPILIKGKPRYLAGYTMDITERKQMERELIHSERMAIAGQLAAGVAHEFNNLLSIIGGSAEYAKGIRNENEIKKSLDVIVKSANRGAQVVKKLLTFTKRIELKKELVDLIEVIEEVVGLVKRYLENNSITVVRNYSDIPKTFKYLSCLSYLNRNTLPLSPIY